MTPEDTDVVVSVMEQICAFNDADSDVYDLHDAANLLNQALPIAREYARLRPLYEELLALCESLEDVKP